MSDRGQTASTPEAIRLRGVARSFGAVAALDDVSFTVPAGAVTGLLGHNGAGKTTLVRVCTGLLAVDRGSVEVLGRDPLRDGPTVRRRSGVLSESPGLEELLTVRESLELRARIAGMDDTAGRARSEALLGELGLAELLDRQVRGLSAGQRQRVALGRALLADPELLFFDEPTTNMDPIASRQVYDIMARHRDRGGTVVLCTHDLGEAAGICDQVVILERGRVLAEGSTGALTSRAGLAPAVRLRSTAAGLVRLEALLGTDGGRQLRRTSEDSGEVAPLDEAEVPGFVAWLVQHDVPVRGIEFRTPTLADAYLALHRPTPRELVP